MALVVHVHHVWRHLVQVIVNCRDLETAREQAGHHRWHFLIEEHEIAHDHHLVSDLLERGVGPEGKRGLDGHPLHGHGQVGPWHADPEDVAGLQLT